MYHDALFLCAIPLISAGPVAALALILAALNRKGA